MVHPGHARLEVELTRLYQADMPYTTLALSEKCAAPDLITVRVPRLRI